MWMSSEKNQNANNKLQRNDYNYSIKPLWLLPKEKKIQLSQLSNFNLLFSCQMKHFVAI